MENSSEYFYKKLEASTNPGNVLAALYCTLYGIEVTRSEVIMFNRLLKVFHRFTIFFSVIDMVGSYPDNKDDPYRLLFTICKRRFESSHHDSSIQAREPLEGFIAKLDKQIDRTKSKKLKIPSSKGLEPDGRE
jgi:hypothetical protein